MANPYQGLSDFCFWSRSMTAVHPGQVDPVTKSASILPAHKVATMGSCFAQHLAKHIKSSGLNYYVAETAPLGMNEQAATEKNYGVFSARYGNVYTVKQAVQLFDRAFGDFSPIDAVWGKNGRFVDAFRPQVEPEGYATVAEVKEDRVRHLTHVRDVFTKADWFIFTLGLTEAWRSKHDGAIYPIAPGVSGGEFDASKYEFVNFSSEEIQSDLCLLIEKIREVNPQVKILLTVSPVPLIATYESRHVWVSTTFSKAALRVAADVAERRYENIIYFPSYEIITSPAAGGSYYEDDLRQIKEVGVKHVMRIFGKHFFSSHTHSFSSSNDSASLLPIFQNELGVVCDEEVIERALRASGYLHNAESQSLQKPDSSNINRKIPDDGFHYLGSDERLFSETGQKNGSTRQTTGKAGYLTYGPYLTLPVGSYLIRLYGQIKQSGTPMAYVEVTIQAGLEKVSSQILMASSDSDLLAEMHVFFATLVSNLEVRVWVSADSDLNISELEIFPA